MQNNPMPENIVPWLQTLQRQVDALKTRETGTIYVNEQIVSVDPYTGVKTILGDLGGRTGLQQWVGDTEPPAVPTIPYVVYSTGGYTITWDGGFEFDEEKTPDFAHCKIYGTNGVIVAYVGTLTNTNDTAPYTDIVMNDSWSFWLTSVDENGNESGPGEMSPSILATPLVESPDIQGAIDDINKSVQAAKDAATQATAAANLASNALQAAQEAALAAIGAETGKGGVILSENQPTDPAYLDGNWLWINESAPKINHDGDPNTPSIPPPFVYNGTNWIQSADPAVIDAAAEVVAQSNLAQQAFDKATDAAEKAGIAQTAANSKNRIWYETPPVDGEHQIGDTWFDSNDDNKIKVWDGDSWETKRDQLLTQVNDDLTGVKTTVGSKNASYFLPSEPQGTTDLPLVRGDLWFDISDEYKLHTYDGANWQVTQDTAGAITTAAEDAAAKDVALKQAALTEAAITAQNKADAALDAANKATALVEGRSISRGTDLVTNGTGKLLNNYNFPAAIFDPTDAPDGTYGSFVASGSGRTLITEEAIPVDPARTYLLRLQGRQQTLGDTAAAYSGLSPFDAVGNQIFPYMYMYQTGTTTTLAQALNPGDTVIHLVSAENWYNGSTGHMRTVTPWNYKDPNGKTWPVHTYSRDVIWGGGAGAYAQGAVNYTANTVTLSAPYAGVAKPAGTPISNSLNGGNYMYGGMRNDILTDTWTTYSGIFSGLHTDGSVPATNSFPPGTAGVRVIMLGNRFNTTSRHAFAAISFSDATAAYVEAVAAMEEAKKAHGAAGSASELAGAALNAATHTGQNLFDDDPPSGTAPKGTMWFQNNLKGTVETAPPQAIIGMWQQVDGSAPVINADGTVTNAVEGGNWQPREVSKEVVGNLDAGMITSGFISAARIQAGSLTIGLVDGLQTKVNTYDKTANTVTGITNEAGQVVATNITGTLSTDTIPELAQSKITDLSTVAQNASDAKTKVTDWTDPTTGGVKATVVDGELTTTNIPKLGTDKVTGLDTISSNASTAKGKVDAWVDTVTGGVKATVINGSLKTSNIPTLDPSKVTGLPAVVTKATNADTLTQLWKTPGTNVTTINGGTIATGTVEAEKLGATIIEAGYIKSSFLDSEAIRGKLILAELIDAKDIIVEGSITATSALIGSIDASKITVGEMSGTRIKGKTITADKLIVASNDNLVVDPYFENDELTNYRLANSTGVWAKKIGSVVGMAYVSGPSTPSGTVNNFKLHASKTYEFSEVIPNKKYRIRFQSNVTSGFAWVKPAVKILHANGQTTNVPADDIGYFVVNTASWQWVSYTWTAPVDAVAAMFFIECTNAINGVNLKTPTVTGMGDGELIVDGAITATKIDTDAVTAEKIKSNAVTTAKLDAGAITAKHTITGALIQTDAASLLGVKFKNDGITAYDSLGKVTFHVDSTTGSVTAVGTFQTDFSGPRVVISDRETISAVDLFADTTAQHGALFTEIVGGIYRTTLQHYTNDFTSVATLQLNNDGAFQLGSYPTGGTFQGIWGYPSGDLALGNNGKAVSISGPLRTFGTVKVSGNATEAMLFEPDSSGRTVFRTSAPEFVFASTSGGFAHIAADRVQSSHIQALHNLFVFSDGGSELTLTASGPWYLGMNTYPASGAGGQGYVVGGNNFVNVYSNGAKGSGANWLSLPDGARSQLTGGFNIYGGLNVYNGTKNFAQSHPTKPGMELFHAATESPYSGTEYWGGDVIGEDGYVIVVLPDYFEALNSKDNRSTLVTGNGSNVTWTEIFDGEFMVEGAPNTKFSWLVKAKREGYDFDTEQWVERGRDGGEPRKPDADSLKPDVV